MKRLLLLPLLTLLCYGAYAKKTPIKKHELYYGVGILSLDELKGFLGNEPVQSYMSFPYAITCAQFITYRYRVSKRFAIGTTIGLDNQSGELSYGDDHHGGFHGGLTGVSGHYSRCAYSIAAEAVLTYVRDRHFRFGGFIGFGYCLANSKYTFLQGIQAQNYFYGTPTSLVPTNPYTLHRGYYTYQVTPFSLRFGGTVAGFFELGFGYKGLMSGGVSVKL